MPKPPPPPKTKPSGEPLAEVERALSVLHGRHPDAVRAERETQAALLAKRASADALARRAAARERRTRIVFLAAGAVLVALGGALWSAYSRGAARASRVEAALAPAIAPYLAQGYSRVAGSRLAQEIVELAVSEPSCLVAFASRSPGDGSMRVERLSGALEGSESIAWCTCGAERATVRLRATGSGGGLGVVRIGAREVGGDYGLYFEHPRANVIAPPDECSSESLDAWIDKGLATVRPDDGAVSAPLRDKLSRSGFGGVTTALPELPFAVLPGGADTCAVAWSTSGEDVLSVRLSGGDRPIADAKGLVGVCTDHGKSATVWRKGRGELVVERVSAARIGGVHGLREATRRLGFPIMTAWVGPDELAWDASAALQASGVPAPEIAVSIDGHALTHAGLLALSIAGGIVTTDGRQDAFACEPPLMRGSQDAVCVQSMPLGWHVVGSVGKAGIAEAPLPFWMRVFGDVADPLALAVELSTLKLGRRLVTEGFEATTLAGVTETNEGALVTGRAGDDAIVALLLTREAPWVAPCSEGDPWALGEEPVVVSLPPGAQVKLVCGSRRGESRDRRTVVFRHPKSQTEGRGH
jgi:hypothetical protein